MATKIETPEMAETQGSASSKDRLREQTRAVGEDLKQLGRLTKDAAQEKLDEARERAHSYVDQGKQKAGDLEGQIVAYVREKPVKSLLIVAGVGMLLGMFMSRR